MRVGVLYTLLGVSLLLTSCADMGRKHSGPANWPQHLKQISALTHWSASGKLAIRTDTESQSGSMQWQQEKDDTHIMLTGPLGFGATSIDSDSKMIHISRDGDTKSFDLSSPGAGEDAFVWSLPLQDLPYWIRGLPSPRTHIEGQVFQQNLLQELQQQGWTITYENYASFERFTLPTRVTIERDGTRARLIIRNWSDLSS